MRGVVLAGYCDSGGLRMMSQGRRPYCMSMGCGQSEERGGGSYSR